MPIWDVIVIAVTGALMTATVLALVYYTHRTMPERQAAQGDPKGDLSAPIPMDVAKADDLMESGEPMTSRELEEEREREARPRARNRVATYEIVRDRAANSPADVVGDLPPAELGEVLFHQGHFWRVDAIEPAQSRKADGRLIVSPTTDAPKSRVA